MTEKKDTKENSINTILNEIENNYVDSIDLTLLIENSIHAILKNLDPHSIYMNPEEVNSSIEMMQGSFEGIGVEFAIHKDTIIIINVIKNGPSEQKGLLAGERITYINDEKVAGIGITNQDVIKRLRGKRGTKVNVGINNKQDTTTKFISITRDKIPLVSLDLSYEIAPGIGYIKLNRFSATTFNEFKSELKTLQAKYEIKKLILDLRGNNGGYLDQAIKILNEFFEDGKLLVYTEGNARQKQQYFSDFLGTFKNGDLCVLINESSASASEIIAGAVQDHGRGFIVGERSFGKGLVQEQINLDNGGLIRLTVSRYYTPSGRCIQKPYSKDIEKYFSEPYLRSNAQTIDTLEQFSTLDGRVVYGGGGITPDYIIKSKYDSLPTGLVYLYTSDFFQDLAFNYVDLNRVQMKSFDVNKFALSKTQKYDLFSKIQKWMITEIGISALEVEQYKEDIFERLSALMIRQCWGWSEMQIFLNQNDEIISTSLSLLK